jgi:cell division protein FtsN
MVEPIHAETVINTQPILISRSDHVSDTVVLKNIPDQSVINNEPGTQATNVSPKFTPASDSVDFIIQVGAFRNQTNAINESSRAQSLVTFPVSIIFESKFYKVRIYGTGPPDSAKQLLIRLSEKGFPDAFFPKKK